MKRHLFTMAGLMVVWLGADAPVLAAPVLAAPAPVVPDTQPETYGVATLPPAGPHRFFVSGFQGGNFDIINGDTGKLEGSIPRGYAAGLAIAPDKSRFYVSETYWTHGRRGTREDLLSVYDATTLNLLKEVNLPSRMLGSKLPDTALSADGSKAYIYIMRPASSVVWVDLKKLAVGHTIEIPGCALVFPWGDSGFSSLCGDGSLTNVVIPKHGAAQLTHTKPFFDANNDPIYDNSFVNPKTGDAVFLSYTGLVYEAMLGPTPVIKEPWSINVAAGFAKAGTGVQELAWRPGGNQPAAYSWSTHRLYVLMHVGDYWTHKQGGTEIWVLDTDTHKLVRRIPLQPIPTSGLGDDRPPLYTSIGVSQDAAKPLIYLPGGGNIAVLDANTGKQLRKIDFGGGSILTGG